MENISIKPTQEKVPEHNFKTVISNLKMIFKNAINNSVEFGDFINPEILINNL